LNAQSCPPAKPATPKSGGNRTEVRLTIGASREELRCRFHVAQLDEEVHECVVIAEELRAGISRGELLLYYQPQANLHTGKVIGLEALVRWNHPERGMLMPDAFVAIAERTGTCRASL
jgi:predicted signal transduction protein with EAL and GGDEF domain